MGGSTRYGTVRTAAAAIGILSVAAAFCADAAGFSSPGIGRGQIIIALFGLLLIACSVLKNPGRVYRAAAVVLLNTLILLVMLEFAATGFYMIRARSSADRSGDRSDPHAKMLDLLSANYAPYVTWREVPHRQVDFTIDTECRRVVTGASEDPDAYEVFMFGGSTMIGWGVPDSLTIPSMMQKRLSSSMSVPVRVVNFGQQAYVSTQELIELMLQLQDGRRPDLVVFYDGINDTFAALQSGIPGVHQNLDDIARRYAGIVEPVSFWESLSSRSNLLSLAREALPHGAESDTIPAWSGGDAGADIDWLSDEIVSVYSANCGIVRALGDDYGFVSAFFWQPYLGSGEGTRILSSTERNVAEEMETGDLSSLLESTYSRASALEDSIPGFTDISGCLDGSPGELFEFGDFCHINAEGNRIVVETMIDSLVSDGTIPDSLFREPAVEPATQ